MKVQKNLDGKVLELKPIGRIDTATAPQLAEEVVLDDLEKIVFDLAEVDYISSAGLRLFLATHQQMEAKGGKMILKNARKIVMDIFDIAGFSDAFCFE